MNSKSKLSYAIAAILGGTSAGGVAHAAAATDTADTGSDTIQEITVTAQRRVENAQDVPITIQALTGVTLQQLHVQTFDDFVKYLPNVTVSSAGPGQGSIFMRGLSVGVTGQQGTGTTGPFPNVAVYLDEQSGSLPGRNLDVYAADIERIEVLEGPQGTLFGSGAQAGVLRYITNKPKLDTTEGSVNAGYSYTAGGNPNSNANGMINIPLIDNTLAVRGVIYSDSRGGYIDNVPSTFTRQQTDEGFNIHGPPQTLLPTNSVVINNYNVAANDINPVTYSGIRVSALWKINNGWDALLAQSYQNMDAQGVFYQMPYGSEGTKFNSLGEPYGGQPLGPDQVTLFTPSYNKDKFENTALTINGQIGDLKVVYAGGYLVRNIEQQQDYTNYSRGVWGFYYQCAGYSKAGPGAKPTGTCYSPAAPWTETEKNTHNTQELRVSTPDDWRIRGIGGVYWEEFKIYDNTEWLYKTVPTCTATFNNNCFNNVQPWPGGTANQPGVRNDNIGFFDDFQRTIIQKAAFGSIDYEIIPKKLILTAGTRYYRFNEDEKGGDVGSFYCKHFSPTTYFGPCTSSTNGNGKPGGVGNTGSAPYGVNLNLQNPNSSVYTGFRSRANLSWHATDDILLYYTWSQGFRPGGFNRGSTTTQPEFSPNYQYATPKTFSPDTLTNNEMGFKTEFFAHRLQLNGAVYQEDWKNTIVEFFDPQQGFGNLTFSTNGPNYRVRGFELQAIARLTEGLTVTSSGAYNKSTQENSPYLVNNNPTSPNFGKPLTQFSNVFGLQGSPLAQSPLYQLNTRIRYEFPLGEYKAFVQGGGQYNASVWSNVGTVDNYYQSPFATFDASAGFAKDAWNVQFFSQNIGNKNASTYTSTAQFVQTQTVLRPRIAGVMFGYKF
jgi:outer membrane receptor protein involved in Fe transport